MGETTRWSIAEFCKMFPSNHRVRWWCRLHQNDGIRHYLLLQEQSPNQYLRLWNSRESSYWRRFLLARRKKSACLSSWQHCLIVSTECWTSCTLQYSSKFGNQWQTILSPRERPWLLHSPKPDVIFLYIIVTFWFSTAIIVTDISRPIARPVSILRVKSWPCSS